MAAPSRSASSQRQLITSPNRMASSDNFNRQNPLMRDPSTISAGDIGFPKVLESDADVGEQTVYQVEIENEELLRKDRRSELASKKTCLTRRWQTALVSSLVILALAGGIGKKKKDRYDLVTISFLKVVWLIG